jgi:hypothetical protein
MVLFIASALIPQSLPLEAMVALISHVHQHTLVLAMAVEWHLEQDFQCKI